MIKSKFNKKTKFWENNEIVNRKNIQNNFYKHFLDDKDKSKINNENSKVKRIKKNSIFLIKLDKNLILEKVNYLLDFYKNENKDPKNIYIKLKLNLTDNIKQHYKNMIKIKLPNQIYNINSTKILVVIDENINDNIIDPNLKKYKNIKVIKFKKMLEDLKNTKIIFKKFEFIFSINEKLYKLLNKKFLQNINKYNNPLICLDKEVNIDILEKNLNGTFLKINLTSVFNLKVAKINQTKKEIVKNIINGFYNSIGEILSKSQKYTSLKSLNIYMNNSILLDIYYNEKIN